MFLSVFLLVILGFPALRAQSKSGDIAARLNTTR
jgi:hypothetical protein